MTTKTAFDNPLSADIWDSKYRYRGADRAESSIEETWQRVAQAIAADEGEAVYERFLECLHGFRFLPGGRILAGAGTARDVTLCNCFVMGRIDDSLACIFERLKESALTMQWGGGIGLDFSTLRPFGSAAVTRNAIASGPVSFMHVWDAMCAALMSTGSRRGAMMGTLRCDHPDVHRFIAAKRERGALTNFNLSLLIPDAFMRALHNDDPWPLRFPVSDSDTQGFRATAGPEDAARPSERSTTTIGARELWTEIIASAYETAEPGVLFVDRINALNNLYYREQISATNPCGEVPLPPYGACVLGSINLTTFVQHPFAKSASLDTDAIAHTAASAVRFLDNVIDRSRYPLEAQRLEATNARRIGLGVTGLADALMMLGAAYDSDRGREIAAVAVKSMRDAAYSASVDLAQERGAFSYFERDAFLAGRYVQSLPARIRDAISRHGVRHSHLIAMAPTGTISLLANNVSTGIEPVFAYEGRRRILDRMGSAETRDVVDYAYRQWRAQYPRRTALPAHFRLAREISTEAHLLMQAALQPFVDNSISKTINVPETISPEAFRSVYERAFELGLKGCTVFRPTAVRGEVLSVEADAAPGCRR